MAFHPGKGIAALAGTTAVLGTVLAFHLLPGGGDIGPSEGDVRNPAAPGAEPFGTVPPGPPTLTGGGNGATPGPDGTGTGGGSGGAGGAGDLGWHTRIEQPDDPAKIDGNVRAGHLAVLTPGSDGARGRLTVDRAAGTASGTLQPIVVQDFRGSRNGWTLVGTMSDFRADDGSVIDADRLVWNPHCSPHPGGGPYPSSVQPGKRKASSRTATLCSTAPSDGITGGEFDVGADLTLRLPDRNTAAESYTATLVLTLS